VRAVLDTNVVMSAIFFGGTPMKIVRAAFSKKVQLVASRAVMSEYREVAERLPLTDSEYAFFGGRSAFRRNEAKFLASHVIV